MTDDGRHHAYTFLKPTREGTAFCLVCQREITAEQWARDEKCPGRKQ
jgi:hypothetical protein